MFMAFLARPSHRARLIAAFAIALAVGLVVFGVA